MKIKAIAVILIISSILGACSKNNLDKNKETEYPIYETKNQNVSVLSKNNEEETGASASELEVVNPKEFGNAKEVLDNIVITSNVEVKKSKADELQIEFELDNVGVCIFVASKGKELSLPKETFVDSTKIKWTALTADEEYIFPYMKVNKTGDMFMIDWTYKDYNFAIYGKSPQNTSDRDMAGKIALAIIRNLGGEPQDNHEEITPTGYPSDEIQRQQIMYNGVLYYYTANGFDNPLPDGYEFVGKVKKVDNKQEPTADWCGSHVDIGQKIYVSDNTSVIYLEYEMGYAAFAAVETEQTVQEGVDTLDSTDILDIEDVPSFSYEEELRQYEEGDYNVTLKKLKPLIWIKMD